MNRFVACVCVGLMVLLSPPRANAHDGKGQRFTDVTAEAGVAGKLHGKGVAFVDCDKDGNLDVFVTGRPVGPIGQGIAVGDFDNDGWPDLFVSNLFGRRLYRNNGDGTFTDITQDTRHLRIETIKIEGGKVEITGDSISVEGGKIEIIRREP
jgi:FG-GAP-like repeat